MKFDTAYYENAIDQHHYERLGLGTIDFPLAGMSPDDLQTKWVCHTGARQFAEAVAAGQPAVVTTGIGLGGPPHAGTLFQLLRAVKLQQCGLDVQIVLGDLDSFNARRKPLDSVRRLADQYEEFVLRLGFDAGRGVLRRQEGETEVLATAFLLSRYMEDDDFHWAEEDLAGLYRNHGVFDHLNYGMKQATLLMAADFVQLLREGRHVLVSLGVDEHKYVALARRGAERWGLPAERLSGIYTKMIPGLGGLPKMSKSIPGSGIDASMCAEDIRALLESDTDGAPTDDGSALLQMYACLPEVDGRAYDRASTARRSGGSEWHAVREQLVERILHLFSHWPK
ncbi:tryptophanyl-tRNA ligase [Streptomyces sp. GBA 94-10 4N24]|uniref:tryptophan--tRNA ligase n=1 Tax=Streptomyces sp. GBA 94-10 4N24 TaxID=1218177 RepID=UPI0003C2C605|nr:tryptophan--tRNA ligase [Streptomyces sp. GBA 94-10 4N24]ESP99307.1 tryptophanyl-tRNA ligase [Streptomyces sp. GBA 94-10 4N24]UZN59815.1 tryptophanyl-tRNA ligase [Streptomyces sp. GBA 94-10 4N24]